MGWLPLAAALAPAVFMLHFVYVRDKYEREPLGRVLFIYFLAFFTVIPAAWFQAWFVTPERWGLAGVAVAAWGVIALSEESVKFIVLRYVAMPHRTFNEVYDGVLYGVTVSLGFATVENVAYVLISADRAIFVAILRALLSVPAHALWGAMMGYYIGLAKFEADARRRRTLLWLGWGIAVLWHGLYDFCAFGAEEAGGSMAAVLGFGLLAVVVLNWCIALRYIHKAQALSAFKRPSLLANPFAALRMSVKYCHHCGAPLPRPAAVCTRCGYRFPS